MAQKYKCSGLLLNLFMFEKSDNCTLTHHFYFYFFTILGECFLIQIKDLRTDCIEYQ